MKRQATLPYPKVTPAEGDSAGGTEEDARAGTRERTSRVQSLDRALDILEALAAAGGEIGLSELSERVGLHVSTVHRLLSVLVGRGYARQSGVTGRYALGGQVLRLAASATAGPSDIPAHARPALQALAARSGETTNLVVPLDDSVVYIDQVPSRHMVRMFTQIGTRAPLYCTGAGKAILAHRPEGEVETYLAQARLEPRTAHTLTDPDALRAELGQIRAKGYATDEGEMEEGVRCIAAPICDHTGHALAAVSISGPAARFTGDRIRQVLPALLEATADLSERLGYLPPDRDDAGTGRPSPTVRR